MLKTPTPAQHELEMVTLEELVPRDHLLRLTDKALDAKGGNYGTFKEGRLSPTCRQFC